MTKSANDLGNKKSSGRPKGSENKDKPFREALRIEMNLAAQGKKSPAKRGSLRAIARALLDRACLDTTSAKEIADRLDGKSVQGVEVTGSMTISHEDSLAALDE